MRLELKAGLVIVLCLGTISMMTAAMKVSFPQSEAEILASDVSAGNVNAASSAEGIIRFHIIANSNSTEDQDLKLEIRNQVLSRIQPLLADQFAREITSSKMETIPESKRLELTRICLTEHLTEIEGWAEDTIAEEGFSYSVQGELGIRWIPDREYDGIYFPAGNYEALTLTIGEGSGQNWWCVIYPPLCLIDSSESLRKELGEARFQAWMESMGSGRIVLKSRILEILGH